MPKKSKEVDAYIQRAAEFAKPILTKIRAAYHKASPDIEETMKWSVPHFEYKGIVGSMAAFKQHATFGFWKGAMMKTKGAPSLGRVRLTSADDLPSDRELLAMVKEAVALNEDELKLPRPPRAKVAAELPVPPDLRAALQKNVKARNAFAEFSPSERNEYVEWITEAKQDATRNERLETAVDWIAQGKPRNWKYMRVK
ncbi:MAG: YdeI/OmpD-associated family protein [Gemmatimonadota bacterium]